MSKVNLGRVKGDPGTAATIKIGTTTTLEPGSQATVNNSGNENAAVFNFGIPKGEEGKAASIMIDSVQTLQPEENATVENVGTTSDARLKFGIPRGSDGMTDLVARYEDASEYTATPTSDAPIVINDLNGKTQQIQTNGYQLFDASKLPGKSKGGVNVTNNGDGSFTISGNNTIENGFITTASLTHDESVSILRTGEIHLSCENTTPTLYFEFRSAVGNISLNNKTSLKGVITQEQINDPTSYIYMSFYGAAGEQITPKTIKPMVFQDGDGTWEPFSGGAASPSPDWEQRIAGVGDMGYFDGSLQKGCYRASDGVFQSSGTAVCNINPIKCSQNDNISFEYEEIVPNSGLSIFFYKKDGTFISKEAKSNVSKIEAVAPTDTGYCNIVINPESNIEPQTAGHISVTINGKYASRVESHGKNLIDMSDAKGGTDNGITVTINKDGSYDYVGTAISNITVNVWLKGGYNLDPNDKKKQLIILKPGKYTCKDVVLYQNINRINSSDSRFNKFNIEKETIITGIRATYAEIGKAYNERCYPILVEGEVSEEELTWQPYRHTSIQFPLTSPLYDGDKVCCVKPGESYIDENGDTVVADKMLYGHYHENEKAVLDGSEDEKWSANKNLNGFYQFTNTSFISNRPSVGTIDAQENKGKAMCNIGIGKDPTVEGISGAWIYDGNTVAVCIKSEMLSEYSVSAFMSWLSTHNIEVVYKLAQPWFEPFEDQTPFYNLRSFDDLTYIYSDDPLNPILTVDVAKNQTGGYLLESYAQAQKNAISEANSQSRLSAIEQQLVNQATTPTE